MSEYSFVEITAEVKYHVCSYFSDENLADDCFLEIADGDRSPRVFFNRKGGKVSCYLILFFIYFVDKLAKNNILKLFF